MNVCRILYVPYREQSGDRQVIVYKCTLILATYYKTVEAAPQKAAFTNIIGYSRICRHDAAKVKKWKMIVAVGNNNMWGCGDRFSFFSD